MNPRNIVLRVLAEFDHHPGSLDRLVDRGIGKIRIDHRDRRFIFELVYGVIRRRITIDYMIDYFLSDSSQKRDVALKRILEIGIYQILYMDKVPDHAAVNESVNLTKKNDSTRKYSGLVNAVLRNVINSKGQLPLPDPQANLTERLSVEFSHPAWMIDRWLKNLGLAKTKQLIAFNNERPTTFLRRRVRELSKPQFEAEARPICEPTNGYMNLFYKLKKSLVPEDIRLLQAGLCTVQAPSSGWVVALMDVKKNDHILDVCAAPGGKSTLMAELAFEGTVCACELKWPRLQKVVESIGRMHIRNIYPLLCDGLFPPFAGAFDKVLLDAPCSGSGVLQRHPDARWTRTEADIERLAQIQKKLLDSAASLVVQGGTLVYSTCSLEKEENEAQVEEFLRNHPEFTLDKAPASVPDRYIDINGFLHITPHEHGMDGIFGAKFIKKAHA